MKGIVDLRFPIVNSQTVPVDHGYLLLAAASRLVPAIHHNPKIGLDLMRGVSVGNGKLLLSAQESFFTIRTPVEIVPQLLPLAGKRLNLGNTPIRLGIPQMNALMASTALVSRLVAISGYMEEEAFRLAINRQIAALKPTRSLEVGIGRRRVMSVRAATIVGFGVHLWNLTDVDSLTIQEYGLGGRRRFGCGLFRPVTQSERE
jgi:CRISPR-associated protein Cas6